MSQSNNKIKNALFEHLQHEVYCRLGVSPLHGIGVFALRAIPKGVNPLKSWLKNKEIKFSHENPNRMESLYFNEKNPVTLLTKVKSKRFKI